ncbi:MAG: DUF1861 family protein [Streptococcaceae bacterium]|jgi:hypothetical protein|nr:DUF1861 family protein [Streptococcaceae bacterium]
MVIKIEDLLIEKRRQKETTAHKIVFKGTNGKDVYNITAPFELGEKLLLVGRIESRNSEISKVGLFENTSDDEWSLSPNSISLKLQDPFVTMIDGQVILGGVHVDFFDDEHVEWRTDLYQLDSVTRASKIFEGPKGMKDLRLKQLPDGRILVLTRPQGKKGGRGRIGFVVVKNLLALTREKIENAPLLKNQFIDDEWYGSNEIHLFENKIFVLSHIANFDETDNRHYYSMIFELSSDFTEILNPKIIAERKDFLPSPAKRSDLEDVVFGGGLVLNDDKATLYAGISDAGAQTLIINNPMK